MEKHWKQNKKKTKGSKGLERQKRDRKQRAKMNMESIKTYCNERRKVKKEREREKRRWEKKKKCSSSLKTRVWLEKVILVISCNKLLSVYWCAEHKQYRRR